jgi:hypothetical protein
LFDCINIAPDSAGDSTPYLGIINRGNAAAAGQGWAAGFSIMYNCQVPQFQLEEPTTTTNEYNWVIGGIGAEYPYSDNGIYDTVGSIVSPHSLYLEQLKERLGPAAVQNIGYQVFTVAASPMTNSAVAGDLAAFTVTVAGTNYFSDTVTLSVSGLPAGATASWSTNAIAGSGAATLMISTPVSLATNTYAMTINGIDGNLTNRTTVNLVVTAPVPPVVTGTGSYNAQAGTFTFSFSGPDAQSYRVLTSTNVALPLSSWTVLTNGIFGGGTVNFTDNATNGQKFYRVASP